jgi:hypothetical protein
MSDEEEIGLSISSTSNICRSKLQMAPPPKNRIITQTLTLNDQNH